jgi:hypothetical protein
MKENNYNYHKTYTEIIESKLVQMKKTKEENAHE